MSEQSEILRRELKQLQTEAERILDEIDAKEAEILQIEENESQGALFDLIIERGKILKELKSQCSLSKKIYVDDKNEDILYLRESRNGLKLATFVYEEHTLEEFEEWVKIQLNSIDFYQLLLEHFYDELAETEVYQQIMLDLNESQYLILTYQPETLSVTITRHKHLDYNQIEDLLSKAYVDQKFKKSGIVDSYEIIFTSSTKSFCNLVDLVKTIKQIKSEVKQDLS
mgnify:CR=1 FL=1